MHMRLPTCALIILSALTPFCCQADSSLYSDTIPKALAPISETHPATRPGFWQAETPLQVSGMFAGEVLVGLGGAIIGANIGASRAKSRCRDNESENDECGWAGLGGALIGMAIALPLGQGLGVSLAGMVQGKKGNALVTIGSAIVGDLALFYLAGIAHNALDGKIVPNGGLDPILIGIAGAGMLMIPVATYTLWDYKVRFPFQPKVSLGPDLQSSRLGLQVVQARF